MSNQANFGRELAALINKFSLENGSDTPDFMLADFLISCLHAWDDATKRRDKWYNFKGLTKAAKAAEAPFFLPPTEEWTQEQIRHLEQIGINLRQSKAHRQMVAYLNHLSSEIRITREFLREDGYDLPGLSPNYDNYPP